MTVSAANVGVDLIPQSAVSALFDGIMARVARKGALAVFVRVETKDGPLEDHQRGSP